MNEVKKSTMNGFESNSKSLLPWIQTCDQYLTKIERKLKNRPMKATDSNDSSSSAVALEIQLWQELKGNRNLSNRPLLNLLVGVYVKLLQKVLNQSSLSLVDPYFDLQTSKRLPKDTTLPYNIYIRLGDLHRYLKQTCVSRDFYLKAQELNPNRGQAYNQLALLCTPDPIKSIFYYCRAVMAYEEPSEISRNNILFAVNKCRTKNLLINLIFSSNDDSTDQNVPQLLLTNCVAWIKVLVLSIYSGNQIWIADSLLDYTIQLLSKDDHLLQIINEDNLMTFQTLDVLIDYLMSDEGSQVDPLIFETKLRMINELFVIKMKSLQIESEHLQLAMRHDYFLFGLKFLHKVHSELKFGNQHGLDMPRELICARLVLKLDAIFQFCNDKRVEIARKNRKTRNIALQSILGARKNV